MPFSIDFLSIKSESQKISLNPEPPNMGYSELDELDRGIYKTEGLVEQEPITIFWRQIERFLSAFFVRREH